MKLLALWIASGQNGYIIRDILQYSGWHTTVLWMARTHCGNIEMSSMPDSGYQ